MKIFFHNDMDGKCAAHIVLLFDPITRDDLTCQAINYGIDFPFDIIGSGERVYIVDFSIEPEDMVRLKGITADVIWIDHHKSAIEKYEGFSGDIAGIRSVDAAGCELTWRYFSKSEAPEYVRLIGDRDTWTWKYGDRTKHFFAGLESFDTAPQAPIWDSLSREAKYVDMTILDGKVIQRYKDITHQEYIKENGFWVDFHDYRCYAVNGRYSSQPFEAVVPDADIWIPFRYMKGDYWMVSLLTNKDIDVSVIAEEYKYHGKRCGGHKKAAGYECSYPVFLDQSIIDPDKLMELDAR